MGNHNRQRGISSLSVLLLLIVGSIGVSLGFKLLTPYSTHTTVVSIIEDIIADPAELSKSRAEIRRDIERRFTINQVALPGRDAFKITQDSGELIFTLDYEERVPLYGNIDAVVVFKDEFKAIKP
ncbi:MAG: Uncharacterised protein [Marinobacterium sp. xm-d-530]|jgi:hypothetical protein|nr:MAG: Uncharacterised protein [Marinobacterium sp. xm-d-530]